MDPISVAVERGGVAESRHRVHAVSVRDGDVVDARGNPELVTFMRSAAKPLQALLVVREYPDLTDEEVAIACASHGARPEQLDAVVNITPAKAGPIADARLRGTAVTLAAVARSAGVTTAMT